MFKITPYSGKFLTGNEKWVLFNRPIFSENLEIKNRPKNS